MLMMLSIILRHFHLFIQRNSTYLQKEYMVLILFLYLMGMSNNHNMLSQCMKCMCNDKLNFVILLVGIRVQ